MKWILSLLVCWSASAQLPMIPFNPSASFSPEQIPFLFAEFYADSSADWLGTTAGGSGAAGIGWSNRVNSGDLTRAVTDTGTSPIYANTGPNSLFCIDFTGNASGSGGHQLWAHTRNSAAVMTWSNQPVTWFVVATDDPNAGASVGGTIFDAATGGRQHLRLSTNAVNMFIYSGTILASANGDVNTHNWFIYTACFTNGGSFFRINGTNAVAGNAGTQAMGQMMLANDQSGTTSYRGKLYAILGYAGAILSTNNIIAVERFLNAKANLGFTIPNP